MEPSPLGSQNKISLLLELKQTHGDHLLPGSYEPLLCASHPALANTSYTRLKNHGRHRHQTGSTWFKGNGQLTSLQRP